MFIARFRAHNKRDGDDHKREPPPKNHGFLLLKTKLPEKPLGHSVSSSLIFPSRTFLIPEEKKGEERRAKFACAWRSSFCVFESNTAWHPPERRKDFSRG